MAKNTIKKWRQQKHKHGFRADEGKPVPPHAQQHPAPSLPQSAHVTDLRVDEDLSLSIFDDLDPDQDFMISPTAPTAGHVYTVTIDPLSGKTGVAATDPTTISTAAPAYDEVLSDGGIPSTPVVTLVSGPGWIKVKWGASTGTSDPLHYKVFMRLTSNPTTSEYTYLVADTEDLESVINKLTAGTQLTNASTYKVIVKAYSRVSGGGTSADSSVASGSPAAIDASVTTISNISASNITTGTLAASFIGTGTMSATMTISGTIQTSAAGARVVLDGTNGLRVFDGGVTDYGAGVGITTKLPLSGDPFFRGVVNATGVVLDMDTNSSQQNEKSVIWKRTDGTVAGYIYDYTSVDLEDSNIAIVANPQDKGTSASVSSAVLQAAEPDGGPGSFIRVRNDRLISSSTDVGTIVASAGGIDTTLMDSSTGASLLNKVDFKQVSSSVATAATQTRLHNGDDLLGRGTLYVSKDNSASIVRDLASAPAYHGDSLLLNSYLYTDCGQIGSNSTTNSFVGNDFLIGFTGTGSGVNDISDTTRAGVWELTLGTTAGTSFTNVTSWEDFPGTDAKRIYIGCIFRIPVASNATDRFDVLIGFTDSTDPRAVTNGIFLRYSDSKATPAGTASTLDLVHCKAAARSADALDDNGGAITLSAGNWYMVEMEIIPGTGTSVWITETGGSKSKKVTNYNTNFPLATSGAQFRVLIKRAAGSTNTRTLEIDAIWGMIEYFTSRV